MPPNENQSQPQPVVSDSPPPMQPIAPAQTAQPIAQQPITPPEAGASISKNRKILIAVIGIIVVLVGGAINAFVRGNESPANSTNSSTSSTGSSSSSASTAKTAYQLFTLADARSIMGSSAIKSSSQAPPDGSDYTVSGCSYSGRLGDIVGISVVVYSYSDITGANANYQTSLSAIKDPITVSGVGDNAAWGSGGAGLIAQKGGTVINVISTDEDGNESQAADTQTAKIVVGNL